MKRKIGWQKYENVIEDQLSSPILQELLTITSPPVEMLNTDEFTYEELESLQKEFMEVFQSAAPPTPPTGSQSTKPTSTSFNPSNSEDDSAVDIEEVD